MYFKGKILLQEPGSAPHERLSIVEAENIKEAYAKLIHSCRLMVAGRAPSFEDGTVVFRHGRTRYTLKEVRRTSAEGFLFEHLLICREWWGELDYAEEALAARKEAAR